MSSRTAALALDDLCPYVSVLLGQVASSQATSGIVDKLIDEIEITVKRSGAVQGVTRGVAKTAKGIEAAFLHYVEKKPVGWCLDKKLYDQINQLVVVCRKRRHVAIYASDGGLRERLRQRCGVELKTILGEINPVSAGILNSAFVVGQAQTLWLSGTHRRVASKADNKIITGSNLQFALDPLGDQSYYFTAARCRSNATATGVSPRKSAVWVSLSKNWDEFRQAVGRLFDCINAVTKPDDAPLPILATSVHDSTAVANAYDAAILPAELLETPTQDSLRQEAELWSNLRFEICSTAGADFVANLFQIDKDAECELGRVSFKVDFTNPDRIGTTADPMKPASSHVAERYREAVAMLTRRQAWLKVWYQSGHILADRAIFRERFRDQPFPTDRFLWVDLRKYNTWQEKPSPLAAAEIGNQKSLFCWVKNHWSPPAARARAPRGWLASNDGSMEIADFIHLDVVAGMPTISLIHVKGAGKGVNRLVSVSHYEVVTAQAVKNLRHLDNEILSGNFSRQLDKRIADAVWHNGHQADRSKMLGQLQKVTADYRRQVVILQPHVTQSALAKARAAPENSLDKLRVRQLDTLLLGARVNCQALGADLYVIGDKH